MFKKLFVAFFLLSFCVLPFGGTAQLDSIPSLDNIPSKFKVCVYISEDDSDVNKRLQAFAKRELRALGDVEIVSMDDEWHFLLKYYVLELERKDGSKTGWLSIAFSLSSPIAKSHFKNYDFPGFLKPVYPPDLGAAYYPADDLLKFAIENAAWLDEILKRYHRAK